MKLYMNSEIGTQCADIHVLNADYEFPAKNLVGKYSFLKCLLGYLFVTAFWSVHLIYMGVKDYPQANIMSFFIYLESNHFPQFVYPWNL